MNVILFHYSLSYIYNVVINMLQCLHVALQEPDPLPGMFQYEKVQQTLIPLYDVNLF